MIIYFEVVSRKLLGLIDLARAQAFCIYRLMEVIMVSKDKYLIFAAFKVVAPSFEDFNKS